VRIAAELATTGLIAFGTVVGGSLFAGLAAVVTGRLPLRAMVEMADRLKLWGTFAALGGTFSALRTIESGLFAGQLGAAARQAAHLVIAFTGAYLAFALVRALTGAQ